MTWPTMVQYNAVSSRLRGKNLEQVSRASGIGVSSIRCVRSKTRMVSMFTLEVIRDTLDLLEREPTRGAL